MTPDQYKRHLALKAEERLNELVSGMWVRLRSGGLPHTEAWEVPEVRDLLADAAEKAGWHTHRVDAMVSSSDGIPRYSYKVTISMPKEVNDD